MAKENSSLKERERVGIEPPRKYTVYMHNDDFTPMDFVVMVLVRIFYKSFEDAEKIMLDIHHGDKCAVGEYSYDIAISRKSLTMKLAADCGYPLRCSVEKS